MTGHSKIGASSMHRWQACPGSVRLSQGVESKSSVYAAEGTVAHTVAELILKGHDPKLAEKSPDNKSQIPVTDEMLDAVKVYIDHVAELRNGAQAVDYEVGFHLEDLHSELYGTADFVALKADTLYVRDYKHGQGVPVEAEGNPQLLYYALGASHDPRFRGFSKVNIGVVQPRCFHPDGPIRTWEIDVIDLFDWSTDLLKAVAATEDPNAPLVHGEHCRWCPAAATCPELSKLALETAKLDFKPQDGYSPEWLADTLEKVDTIEAWCRRVRQFAYEEADRGVEIPRHKLVAKRAQRFWKDPEATILFLEGYGLDSKDIYEAPKLKSVTQIETAIGKKYKKDIADFIDKKSTGTVLVHESDKRKAVTSSAEADFSPVA